jgi:hypothetical protein
MRVKTSCREYVSRFEPQVDDGKLFLYSIPKKTIYIGNQVAYYMLGMIENETSLEQMTVKLKEKFPSIPEERLHQDLMDFLQHLTKLGLAELDTGDESKQI